MTLVEFLLARIAEDEASAHEVHTLDCDSCMGTPGPFSCSCTMPARVRAEYKAKRSIIRQARLALQISDDVPEDEPDEINNNGRKHGYGQAFDVVLELMARPHAKHPDYQKEWAE